ncbi:MAG: hypothetical protein KAR42_09040 [candidate division Zixibacteria bacterium]|nr:hypothetical protein [candidate division Zixibacteria bacterium]
MKSKTIYTVVLALFVVVSVSHFVYNNVLKSTEPVSVVEIAADSFDGITVYYFHNSKRCPTCTKIEKLSYTAVHEKFADEIASGKLRWKIANIEEPENLQFAEKYDLIVQSLVIVDNRPNQNGNWSNLEKIWDLVWDEEQFTDYVQAGIAAYLERN